MNKVLSFIALTLICFPGIGAETSNSRRTNAAQWTDASQRVASKAQVVKAAATGTTGNSGTTTKKDTRETEKNACIENNVGVNNTFVWATAVSDTTDYASMIEDTENPENNVCFVKVELTSTDSDIKLDDIDSIYYEMDKNIVCGEWAKKDKIEKRILDGKKTARAWGTVAGSVGGAGVGVGSMELFGNRAIGGKVMGQKDLQKNDYKNWIKSELLELQKKDKAQFDEFVKNISVLRNECNALKVKGVIDTSLPAGCTQIDYETIFNNIPAQ